MKVGLIGLGHWGKNHARVLGNLKKEGVIDELFFYDIDTNLAESMSKFHGATMVSSTEDLIKNEVDAVDIVVPANLHHRVAKPFIEAGIKTFIEKPFTDNEEDAIELIDLSKSPESQIMVGHIFRYHSAVIKARDLVLSGQVGRVQKIDIRRAAFGVPRPDNGVIFSLGIHDLDLFGYIGGDDRPTAVTAVSSKVVGPTEDHAFIKVEYEKGGYIGIAEESWMYSSGPKVRTCSIQGSNGEIFFDFLKPSEIQLNAVYITDDRKLVNNGRFIQTIPFAEPLQEELLHFINQSKEDKPYNSGPSIALTAVKLCLSALESAESGKTVYLDK